MNPKIKISFIILSLFIILTSCVKREDRIHNQEEADSISVLTEAENKIGKVVFYIENSESMFGYVNGFTEYVDVVSELSEKPEFAAEKTEREFYFINGGSQIHKIPLGNNPAVLKTKLSKAGFNCGDITKSNLNSMFQIALEKAQNDTISILISDGIYDIGKPQSPLNALITEGKETRSKFIYRLQDGDLQTLLMKLSSNFNGNYFYSSHSGKKLINQSRPFYIWIFGKSELLNKYFNEEYISQHLKGYEDYARFLVIYENTIPYQITTSINRKGEFRPDHNVKNKLVKAEPRHGEFQFSFAVDFNSLPFSEIYLTDTSNYSCSNPNFKITTVEKIKDNQKHEVTEFSQPTHIITVYTDKNPNGHLEIVLKNEVPNWIKETDIDNEKNIDDTHTFGYKYLTNAISEAYSNKNNGKKLAKFNIEISN